MLDPIKILQIDLSEPLESYTFDSKYRSARILFRWKEKPLFHATLPFTNGVLRKELIAEYLFEHHSSQLYINYLDQEILKTEPEQVADLPFISVAVCTRDRTDNLEKCLRSIEQSDYNDFEVLVIDNAPSDEKTKHFVENNFPKFRYILEEKPGLDWARNRAISEAKGSIIAYTDDDVQVDRFWVSEIAKSFAANPHVMAITGLVTPLELETDSQILFEKYGGFGRGYSPFYINTKENLKKRWRKFGTGQYGTGANMAFRKELFNKIGVFDPALDVGTVTNGGGDLDMMFRTVKHKMTLLYQPSIIVFHQHRRELSKLKEQISNNGIGLYSFFSKTFQAYPDERWQILKLAAYWMLYWNIRRSISATFKPAYIPKELIFAELKGSLKGFTRYFKSKKNARKLGYDYPKDTYRPKSKTTDSQNKIGVHVVELTKSLKDLKGFEEYLFVQIIIKYENKLLGDFLLSNSDGEICANKLKSEILKNINVSPKLVQHLSRFNTATELIKVAYPHLDIEPLKHESKLDEREKVSILIATLDRPDDLKRSLISINNQKTERNFEIVVVDNNPDSKLTFNALKDFPNVKLVNEWRKGLSNARNTGIINCSGDILVITDDDIIAPEDWLENLIANFSDSAVNGVCGNVIPHKLDSKSQILFENYGGLSKGYRYQTFTTEWFHHFRFKAVPTWEIGATANFAIRKKVFESEGINYFIPHLGAGMPAGVGEDTFLFYQMLKNNMRIIYDPSAFLFHKHRNTFKSLTKQIFSYSKGHVGYHLETLFKEGDFRALVRIFIELPLAHAQRIYLRLTGKSSYTLLLLALEIFGNMLGPYAYAASLIKAKRLNKKHIKSQNSKENSLVIRKAAVVNKQIP